jgi:N-acetylglucosamine-6-phosphate deacetylase
MNGSCAEARVAEGRIEEVIPCAADGSLPYFLPVLVDLQHNGALGTAYNALSKHGADRLDVIARQLRRHGVGRCLLTLTTHPYGALLETAASINEKLSGDAEMARLFFGVFHEGLFISPEEGWRGAHDPACIEPPDYARFKAIDEACGNRVRIVNVAPEEPGAMDFISEAVAESKLVALGHCRASAEVIRKAVRRGATLVTHFGNGAAPMVHRFKNPFWEFLDNPELRLGLVCDGFHLPQELAGAALKCKGHAHCYPVSDAAGHSGCPPGEYTRDGGRGFVIEENGHVHLAESEILAGAWFQQDRSVEFLVRRCGMAFLDAWAQCSRVPADIIGIRLPSIAVGEPADFVLARWNSGLVIEQAVHGGVPYLDEPVRPGDAGDGISL